LAFQPDVASVCLDDAFRDGKAQARTTRMASRCLEVRVEHRALMFARDAGPLIDHRNFDRVVRALRAHGDFATWRAVVNCVRDQIGEDDGDLVAVDGKVPEPRYDSRAEPHLSRFGSRS